MQKDVIYIDVEDDITAIIGRVKDAKQKIVALVPPKRIGVLQSAVNLRLIERSAKQHEKKLVLITNNDALSVLAASAKIPVAKNLQSRPELGEIAALDVDDGDDLIDGSQLPVGDHAKQAAGVSNESLDAAAADIMTDSDAINIDHEAPKQESKSTTTSKKRPKVPNFNSFRKKILLFGCLGVLFVAFLVWAIFFAGRATVYITAKTMSTSINDTVTLSTSADTDVKKKLLRSVQQEVKKDVSIDFSATGEKNIGKTATGTVEFSTDSISVARSGTTIPAGTKLTASNNKTYTTDSDVTLTLSSNNGSTGITAADRGSDYNGASGSVDGAPQGVRATITDPTSGGTDKTVKVVTKSDLAKAKQEFDDKDTDSIKDDLQKQFGKDVRAIDGTFDSDTSGVQPHPGVGDKAPDGKATLSGTVVYTMLGVDKSEISHFLDGYFEDQLESKQTQRVYDNGASDVDFSNAEIGKKVTVQMTANGKTGPKIDDAKVKKLAEGKNYRDIQKALQSIQGISNVDTKYWPFWVSHAPNSPDRITVKFNIDDGK